MTTSEKTTVLNNISAEIKSFKGIAIAKNATNAVPGEGSPNAAIMFIGEAPGFNEDRLGRPFVGQAGHLLDKALLEIGLHREDVYITNIIKYRPPDNRDPLPDEIAACAGWLDRQIEVIQPKFIITLGRFSMAKFIPGVTISRIHGQPRFVEFAGRQYTVFPMYHPAAALRAGSVLAEFLADFRKLQNFLHPAPSVPSAPPVVNSGPTQESLFK